MARRARRNSFGTIVSVGTATDPQFHIRWWEGRRRRQQGGFTRRQDAAAALARVRTNLADGVVTPKRRGAVTFDVAAREWLELHSKPSLRSHALNEMNYRVHVDPFLKGLPLSSVTASKVLELRSRLQAKGLAAATTNIVMALVRAVLKFAVTNGHITAAPTDGIGRGRLMLPTERTKLAPPIDRPEDVGRLLEAIRESRPDRFALFATLVYAGLRKGEACGLKWEDIDFGRRVIAVRRSYAGPTKSGAHREVPMGLRLAEILKAHKLAEPWGGDIVFPSERGGMLTKNGKLEDILRAALEKVGLKRIRLHDLRHTHAAHFLMAGGSVYDLQKNLGHHSVAFTADRYGHLAADHRVREADRLSFDVSEPAKVLPFPATANARP